MSCRVVAVLLALVVAAAGCRFRVGAEVAVAADGSGTVAIAIALDAATLELLEEAGFDPLAGLEAFATDDPDWQLEEVELDEDRGARVTAAFAEPAAFDALMAGFHAGLAPEDGAIFDGLDLERTSSGRISLRGRAGLVPPSVPGAEGEGLAFDADDLERLLDERADELVRYDLVVTLPAAPVEHDADEVQGRTLTWHLPVGELRSISAVSEPATERTPWLVAGLGLLAVVVGAVGAVLWRRRSR